MSTGTELQNLQLINNYNLYAEANPFVHGVGTRLARFTLIWWVPFWWVKHVLIVSCNLLISKSWAPFLAVFEFASQH